MIVSVTDIVARIKNLPDDYAEHVKRSGLNTAEVSSFSNPTQEIPYTVWIKMTDEKTEGLRNVGCSCPATKLCDHIASFWAVAKAIKPDGSVEEPKKKDKGTDEKAKETPSEEIKGEEGPNKQRVEIYDQISAAFAKLAELEDQK